MDERAVSWTLEKVDDEVFLLLNGMRARGRNGLEYPALESIRPGENAEKLAVSIISFLK